MSKNQRKWRNFFLQPYLQMKFGFFSIILAMLFSGLVFYTLYLNLAEFVDIVVSLTDTENELKELLLAYLQHTRWWLMLWIGLFLFANVVMSIVVTHKLVGPMVAVRQQLEKMAKGDYSGKVALRKGDAFIEVADALNHLTDILSKKK